MDVDNDHFTLFLPEDWTGKKEDDPEQHIFHSVMRGAHLTISSVIIDFGHKSTDEIADKLLEVRHKAEIELASDRKVFLSNPWSTVFAADDVVQVNYFGYDSLDRYFFFTGFIEKFRIISITGELIQGDHSSLEKFFQETLGSFRFKRFEMENE